ncbi:hypothetical protein B0T21DRAFT_418434 [Apiosordaria backusii]|uniref:Uncharacterized protein n=1 Tax=Apiosordaria backusii TaxID=314023 RepID=A0AA40EXZ7_9PEZI|nr:hypothetical protein B0T21DRAFT_418434 [Apiosordaria backusii]
MARMQQARSVGKKSLSSKLATGPRGTRAAAIAARRRNVGGGGGGGGDGGESRIETLTLLASLCGKFSCRGQTVDGRAGDSNWVRASRSVFTDKGDDVKAFSHSFGQDDPGQSSVIRSARQLDVQGERGCRLRAQEGSFVKGFPGVFFRTKLALPVIAFGPSQGAEPRVRLPERYQPLFANFRNWRTVNQNHTDVTRENWKFPRNNAQLR